VVNICNIAKIENMVAINNGLQADLTGQITSEPQFGPWMINGQGDILNSILGSFWPRAVVPARSCPLQHWGDAASTIVPQLDRGSLVTMPRHFADIIITEYGIARLAGKNHRERANELIGIAPRTFVLSLKRRHRDCSTPEFEVN